MDENQDADDVLARLGVLAAPATQGVSRRRGRPPKAPPPRTIESATPEKLAIMERGLHAARIAAKEYPQAAVSEALPYGIELGEIRRMAGQFMTLPQIAARLGLPIPLFRDCVARFPQLREAFESGMAESIDRTTAVLQTVREAGDVQAIRFTLERKAGWEAPRGGPAVVINTGEGVTIDASHVDELRDRQRLYREIPDAELAD